MQNNPVQQVISFLNHCILFILHDDSRIDADSLADLPQQRSQRNKRSQDKACHEDSHAYRSFHRKIFGIVVDDVVDQRNNVLIIDNWVFIFHTFILFTLDDFRRILPGGFPYAPDDA